MPDLNEVRIRDGVDVPGDILDALDVREICKGGLWMGRVRATQQHLDMIASMYDQPYSRELAVRREKELLERGDAYFAQGYRLQQTERQMFGVPFNVPEEALAWRIVSAGHIATAEARRLQYVVKPD